MSQELTTVDITFIDSTGLNILPPDYISLKFYDFR
jgi:hypothetical protein